MEAIRGHMYFLMQTSSLKHSLLKNGRCWKSNFHSNFFLLMLSKISEIISIWLFLKLHATLNTHSLLFSHGAPTINITPCFYSMQHYSFLSQCCQQKRQSYSFLMEHLLSISLLAFILCNIIHLAAFLKTDNILLLLTLFNLLNFIHWSQHGE